MRTQLLSLACVPLLLASCGSSDSDSASDFDAGSTRRITVGELNEALDAGQAIVVDVRWEESYREGHIEGAISIPLAEIEERSNELPLDKLIVTYCS